MNQNDSIFKMQEVQLPSFADRVFNITDYGAVGDGLYMNTDAFAKAIDACSAAGGGKVVIPAGLWLTGPISFKSNINLHIEKGAVVMFSKNLNDYPLVLTRYEGLEVVRCMAPLYARNCENLAITGQGVFDGNGSVWGPKKKMKYTESQWKRVINSDGVVDNPDAPYFWWPTEQALNGSRVYKKMGEKIKSVEDCKKIHDFLRPVLFGFVDCKKVLLDGPTFQNSAAWCLHPLLCDHLTIRNVSVRNPWNSANGDALDVDSCRYVNIHDSLFDAGDDAMCIKSGKNEDGRKLGRPTEHVSLWNNTVYHGHGGFVIGSEMSGSVRDIKVWNCIFLGTDSGLRFKSARGRGGVVENIYIDNINMKDIEGAAVTFDTYYGFKPGVSENADPVPVTEETPEFRNIYISNTNCIGASSAVHVRGLPEMPINNIHFENVHITANHGVMCDNSVNLSFKNFSILTNSPTVFSINNSKNIAIDKSNCLKPAEVFIKVSGDKSEGIVCSGIDASSAENLLVLGENVKKDAVKGL